MTGAQTAPFLIFQSISGRKHQITLSKPCSRNSLIGNAGGMISKSFPPA